jgi:hypothetical protein
VVPALLNLRCQLRTTFSYTINVLQSDGVTVQPLGGYTADMKVLPKYGGTLLTELSTANGAIVINGALGTITLTIPSSTTAGFAVGTYVYDLLLTSGSVVYPYLTGQFIVDDSASG